MPTVSVVVPTYLRPGLAPRAVASALVQEGARVEVIVVVDGRDAETVRALESLGDERVRIVVPRRNLGNAEARNEGARHATGDWIGFLDDDDEWLPGKLDAQLAAAREAPYRLPIVSCRLLARNEGSEFVWPTRIPTRGQDLSEYLFRRRSPFSGGAMIQTSTILAPRTLVLAVPFNRELARHVDPDWVLRAAAHPGAGVVFVADETPLSVWNIEEQRSRVTRERADWRASLAWVESSGATMTARARASFILTEVSTSAARERDWAAFRMLVAAARRHHRPSALDLAVHAANFLVPRRLQIALAARAGQGVRR